MNKNISAVILAGGANRRFNGITKSRIIINGRTIISGILGTLNDIFEETIIVTNTPDEFSEYSEYRMVGDEFLKKGPLGGIHAGMKASSKQFVFVFAGDMPSLNKSLILNQIDLFEKNKPEILIPKVETRIEPLHALYSVSLLETLEKYLNGNNNNAVRAFLENTNVEYYNLDDSVETRKAFTNINSPSDIVF
jgi:molybdenum cofactor guanylyltransferase